MAKKNAVADLASKVNKAASGLANSSAISGVLGNTTKNNAVMNLATSVAKNLTKNLTKNNSTQASTTQSTVAPVQQEFVPSNTTQSYLNQLKNLEGNAPGAYSSKYQSQIDALLDKINNWGEFAPSDTTKSYLDHLKRLEGNAPGAYSSKYQSQIDALLDKINNREKFSYDFNADPLYQQYKDSYAKMGKEAAINAAANAANLTGGYGNSYAATAAAQANQQYLTQLNDVIPELYNAAIDKYQMEGQDMLSQYGALSDAEQNAYTQYRDGINDYFNNLSYYQTAYGNSLGNDLNIANLEDQRLLNQYGAMSEAEQAAYNQYRDSMSDYYNNLSYYQNAYNSSLGNDWNLANFKYQQARDQVSDQQWKDQFEENVRQFGLNYALQKASQELAEREYNTSKDQWQQQFDYSKTRDQVSDQQWKDQFDYSKERDLVSDSQWQKQFNYNKQQDAISNALAKANANASTTADDSSNTADTVDEVARIRDLGMGDIVDFAMSQAQWGKMGGNNDPVYDYLYTQYEKGKISDTELEAIYNYVKMQKGK